MTEQTTDALRACWLAWLQAELDESVADVFRAEGFDPVVIGDCTGVGYLEGAIRDGFHAGLGVG